MKTFYFIALCILLTFPVLAQVEKDYYVSPVGVDTTTQYLPFYKKSPFSTGTHVSLQAGAGFSVFGKESVFNNWVAPQVNFELSPRFHLALGTMVMHNNLNSFSGSMNNEQFNSKNSGFTQYFLFAQGEYFLNDNISITGTTMHELPNLTINSQASNYNSVGMNIKLSDNFSISTSYTFSKGINYYGLPGNYSSRQSNFPFSNNFSNLNW